MTKNSSSYRSIISGFWGSLCFFQKGIGFNKCAYSKFIAGCLFLFAIIYSNTNAFAQAAPNVQLSVTVLQPVSPYLPQLQQDLMGSNPGSINNSITNKININLVNKGSSIQRLKLTGSIERIAPEPMSISVAPGYQPPQAFVLTANQSRMLTKTDLESTFGGFSKSSLDFNNFNWDDVRQNGINYKLPEGSYRICIRAYDYDMPGAFVEACAYFQICYQLSAPQFIAPFNTMAQFQPQFEELKPNSPQIQFLWMAPASTCGLPTSGIQYNFEMRRVFDGQSVQDAINSIPVFEKQGIYTNMFLFDTLLNQGVLQDGKKYIARIKAIMNQAPNSPITIDNNGYSQILAFTYHSAKPVQVEDTLENAPPPTPPTPEVNDSVQIVNADCDNIPAILNTTAYTGELKDSTITIGAFTLNVLVANKNNDNTFTGSGYITWKPFALPLSLKVTFKNIKINTAKQVYEGQVISVTDPTSAQIWDQLARAVSPSALNGLMGTGGAAGIQSEIQKIQSNPTQYALNKINQQTQLSFPLGINDFQLGSTSNTLAIAGINFSPTGASMQVMFSMNVPEANDWLSLAGTGFCVTPDGFDMGDGYLYMPADKKLNLGGNQFAFKGGKNNSLDTLTTTYLKLKDGSVEKIRVHATLALDPSAVVSLDASGKRIAGDSVIMDTHFDFTNWEDWIATLVFNKAFEITSIPGFQINATSGLYYDHSSVRNPSNFIAPQGYVISGDKNEFKGLYIKDLDMKFPKDFAITNNGARMSLNFHNFIIDNYGVSTALSATKIIDISTGKLGGWAFSLDTFRMSVIKNAPSDSMSMLGQLKLPVSTTAFAYTCNLNTGELVPGSENNKLQFTIKPVANMDFSVLNSKMNLFPTSNLQIIINSSNQTIITADLNGEFNLSISDAAPKIEINNLEFQNFKFANTKNISGTGGSGFSYDLGALKFAGISITKTISNPAEDEQNNTTKPSGDAASNSIGGFAFKIESFKPVFGMEGSDYKLGISFDASIDLGFGDAIALGAAAKDIAVWGVVNTNKAPAFGGVSVAGIGIKGEFGPVTVDGALVFHANDASWGNGLEGAAMVKFPPGVEVGAYLAFGKKADWSYFGFAANAELTTGIPIGPINIFGFNGGFFNNMEINYSNAPSAIKQLLKKGDWTIPTATPKKDKMQIIAGIKLAYVEKKILKAGLSMRADFNTSNGLSMSLLRLEGEADIISANDDAAGAIKGTAKLQYDFDRKSFDGYFGIDIDLLGSISVKIPIWMHVGNKPGITEPNNKLKSNFAYWLYIGYPANEGSNKSDTVFNELYSRIRANVLKIGNKSDAIYVNLEANAYFCVGSELPPFPGLPDEVKAFLGDIGGNSNSGMGGGIMFGASVTGQINVQIMPFYFNAEATIGFDMQLKNNEGAICGLPAGTAGLNNWYATGQFYAYLAASAGVYIDVWFFEGRAELVALKIGAALKAGLPNPTWGSGRIQVYGSVLGGLIRINTGCQFEFGKKCVPSADPLKNIKMITEIGPTDDDASVFSAPYAYFSMPMSYRGNNKQFSFEAPADDKHLKPYLRFYKFDITNIEIKDMKNNKVVTGFDASLTEDNYLLTIFNGSTWSEEAKHQIKITAQAFELRNGKWGNPVEYKKGKIESETAIFTTGKGPKTMNDLDIVYSYPIRGQKFLLKNEFNKKGTFKIYQWASTWFQIENENNIQVNAIFTPYDGGNFIKMPVSLSEISKTMDFAIPANLNNSTKYKLQIVVEAPEKTTTKKVDDVDLLVNNRSGVNNNSVVIGDLLNNRSVQNSTINTTGLTNQSLQITSIGNLDKNPNVSTGISARVSVGKSNSTNTPVIRQQGVISSNANPVAFQSISGSTIGNKVNVSSITSNLNAVSGLSINKNIIRLDSFAEGAFLKGKEIKVYQPSGNGRVIYETVFATSKFNTFTDKINAFGNFNGGKGNAKTEKYKVAYSSDKSVAFNDMNIEPTIKSGTEPFDELEVCGDVRKVGRTGSVPFTMNFPPVFTVRMLNMNPGQNDASIKEMRTKSLYFPVSGMSVYFGTINREYAIDISKSYIPFSLVNTKKQRVKVIGNKNLFIVSSWDQEYARDFTLLKNAYANYSLKSEYMPYWLGIYDDLISQYQKCNRSNGNIADKFITRVKNGSVYSHGTNYFGLVNEEWYGGFGTTINSSMTAFKQAYSAMMADIQIQFNYNTDFHTTVGQKYFNDKFAEILVKAKKVQIAAQDKETYVQKNQFVAAGKDGREVSISNENLMFSNTAKNNLNYFKTNKFVPMPTNSRRTIRFKYSFSDLNGLNVFDDQRYKGQQIEKSFLYNHTTITPSMPNGNISVFLPTFIF